MKKISILLLLITTILLTGCQNKNDLNIDFNIEGNTSTDFTSDNDNPLVAMKIGNYGAIVIELYPDIAPNTVNNFIYLTKTGFYDNNTFHRLVKGFVLQGGDPTGTGSGGPGYHIQGEFTSNHFKNELKHTEGIVSMARSSLPNSAGSQFFICLGTASNLDGEYAAFGKVIQGMDTIKKIENNEKTNKEILVNSLKIKKALVNTKGKEYPDPEKN